MAQKGLFPLMSLQRSLIFFGLFLKQTHRKHENMSFMLNTLGLRAVITCCQNSPKDEDSFFGYQTPGRFVIAQAVYSCLLKCQLCLFLWLSPVSFLLSSITHILLCYFPIFRSIYLGFKTLLKLRHWKSFWLYEHWKIVMTYITFIYILGIFSPQLATKIYRNKPTRDSLRTRGTQAHFE